MENIEIIAAESGIRIDAWVSDQMPELTRSAAQRLLADGMILVNGKAPKKNYKVNAGDTITVTIPEAAEVPLIPQNIPIDIVYEDEDVVVVNKPRGMVVPSPLSLFQKNTAPSCGLSTVNVPVLATTENPSGDSIFSAMTVAALSSSTIHFFHWIPPNRTFAFISVVFYITTFSWK